MQDPRWGPNRDGLQALLNNAQYRLTFEQSQKLGIIKLSAALHLSWSALRCRDSGVPAISSATPTGHSVAVTQQ